VKSQLELSFRPRSPCCLGSTGGSGRLRLDVCADCQPHARCGERDH
jgi:hypothetical protein